MKLFPQGVDREQTIRVIGIEFTLKTAYGNQREELQMFVPREGVWDLPRSYSDPAELQITVHTSDGDRAATIRLL